MTTDDDILDQRPDRPRAWTADDTYHVERRARLCSHSGCRRIVLGRQYCRRHEPERRDA